MYMYCVWHIHIDWTKLKFPLLNSLCQVGTLREYPRRILIASEPNYLLTMCSSGCDKCRANPPSSPKDRLSYPERTLQELTDLRSEFTCSVIQASGTKHIVQIKKKHFYFKCRSLWILSKISTIRVSDLRSYKNRLIMNFIDHRLCGKGQGTQQKIYNRNFKKSTFWRIHTFRQVKQRSDFYHKMDECFQKLENKSQKLSISNTYKSDTESFHWTRPLIQILKIEKTEYSDKSLLFSADKIWTKGRGNYQSRKFLANYFIS